MYIPVELRRQVRADAGRRCGYCRSPEVLTGMPLEIEHIIPEAAGGLTVRENLWLTLLKEGLPYPDGGTHVPFHAHF